jgi:hypothetical protein
MSLATTKQALVRWHDMVTTRDMSILNELLAEDVVFRSPVAFNPYPGKQVVFFILSNVIQVFENFTYHREFFTEDGLSVVLEFSANVGEKKLKGFDFLLRLSNAPKAPFPQKSLPHTTLNLEMWLD